MNLLIVESPGKIKKIQGFLGDGWKVAASNQGVSQKTGKDYDLFTCGKKPPACDSVYWAKEGKPDFGDKKNGGKK